MFALYDTPAHCIVTRTWVKPYGTICGVLICINYVCTFAYLAYIRKQNNGLNDAQKQQHQARDRRLLYQGVAIGASLVICNRMWGLSHPML